MNASNYFLVFLPANASEKRPALTEPFFFHDASEASIAVAFRAASEVADSHRGARVIAWRRPKLRGPWASTHLVGEVGRSFQNAA